MDETPLHKAVRKGSVDSVRSLLSAAQLDVNARDAYCGNTALHLCIILQKSDVILKLLCEHPRLDVGVRNNQGLTALEYALNVCELRVVRIILDSGGCVNRANLYGKTALHLATRDNDLGMLEYLLLNKGADVNARDVNGRTPLHLLAIENALDSHLGAFKLLLKNGADLKALDDDGRTPLDYLDEDARVMFLNDEPCERKDAEKVQTEDARVVIADKDDDDESGEIDSVLRENERLKTKVRRLKESRSHTKKKKKKLAGNICESITGWNANLVAGVLVLAVVLIVNNVFYFVLFNTMMRNRSD